MHPDISKIIFLYVFINVLMYDLDTFRDIGRYQLIISFMFKLLSGYFLASISVISFTIICALIPDSLIQY